VNTVKDGGDNGYARVTDLATAPKICSTVAPRRTTRTTKLLQLLFRSRDAAEQAVELSVVGREDEIDVAEVVAILEGAAAEARKGWGGRGRDRRAPDPVPAPPPSSKRRAAAGPAGAGDAACRSPGSRAGARCAAQKKAQGVGSVHAVTPPESAFEADDFDGRFSFRIGGTAEAAEIERWCGPRATWSTSQWVRGAACRPWAGAPPSAAAETKSRHIRV